jgi:hypothetical protein
MCHYAVPKSKEEILDKGSNVIFFNSFYPEEKA